MLSAFQHVSARPAPTGLYDGTHEHDSCGVAFVATMRGYAGHDIVEMAMAALRNLDHRGAVGADTDTGDGAGILVQVPDAFLRGVVDFPLPPAKSYAVGTAFLPTTDEEEAAARRRIAAIADEEGLIVLGWRDLPTIPGLVGTSAQVCMPRFRQIFVSAADGTLSDLALDRAAFCLRRRAERETGAYFPSLSCRTLVYKGMLTTGQLEPFFPDLSDPRFATELAIVHSRFSTNTFPSWPLAHPYRLVAHNGEINTVRGNRNWMRARESTLVSDLVPGDLERLFPVCTPGASDSASFDEVLELLHLGGRSLPHAVLMMIPEAWENHVEMDLARRAFYEYHSMCMEPWDGPASITFTDGTLIGGVLDRNGLRPSRYWVTEDGLVVLASEVGVLDLDPATIVRKGRLQPGRMFLVDTARGRIVDDEELKADLAGAQPYDEWLQGGRIFLTNLPDREHVVSSRWSIIRRQQIFGYTDEELSMVLAPMAREGHGSAIGSMGDDTPLAVLSDRPRLLFDYFKQLFAQVTNPPLDAIREELVTSMHTAIGPEENLLTASPAHCRRIVLDFPVIDNDELAKIVHIDAGAASKGYRTVVVKGRYRVDGGGAALRERLDEICVEVSTAIRDGAHFVVLSDRDSTADFAPIPSLLLTSAVHHHLTRERTRTQVGLIVEAGDVREIHHVALLIGFGAAAVNPYLAMESVEDLVNRGVLTGITSEAAIANLIRAMGMGVLKVMSKMGISTVASYRGAQVFEAIGLRQELVDEYFTGTESRLGGIGLDVIAEEVARRHRRAYPPDGFHDPHRDLEVGGLYQWRREGEAHALDPEAVMALQQSTRLRRPDLFRRFTERVNDRSHRLMTLRGLFAFREGVRPPVPLEEVEPVSEIVKRFQTGAMSYGSISQEAHEALAVAMNSLGGKSNTGEGGEDPDRLLDPERRSAIKQVASGRFGVTSLYLTHSDDIQIKMAQGAKPGEGGQLPAGKVYPWVARTRHSTPGVGLISPPPHHDIYSIEDLAQLIHDLKNANAEARIHVKLVAEVGVGTVAAGVSKAHADVVLISGHDGGTGASPLTSLKYAGAPWELGLAETQQTLVLNGLRDRITVQTDGQLKTGRDVMVAALLGAEEYGFATMPLVVLGCVMMRACHLDTCPVGVATQNPELRARFSGRPEYVQTYFEYLAQEVREYLAKLGFRSLAEAVGHTEMLETSAAVDHWKASGLDLTPVLEPLDLPEGTPLRQLTWQDHGLQKALDHRLITMAADALERGERVRIDLPIRNANRTVGTMLGHELTRRYGAPGLPDDTIDITLTGSAGQSFGAFIPSGITLRLFGDANDYLAKGLSGGRIVVRPDAAAPFPAEDNIIAGNVIAYGATSGELFIRGQVGERFCVRNSGVTAVVEGVGDHGCEYMTGGTVVILGRTGRNFAAGMSGGIGYVLDLQPIRVNPELVTLEEISAQDEAVLRRLITRHRDETGSALATKLLGDWDAVVGRFTKIVPRDYARVVEIRAQAEREGLDPDGTVVWQRIMANAPARRTGFLDTRHRELPPRRPVPVRLKDWREAYEGADPDMARRQANRCMNCGIPFCHGGCPLGNLVPEWNDLTRREDWPEAIERLHATNNFPEFTGRLCPALCESACVLGISQPPVTIRQIELTIVETAFRNGWITPKPAVSSTGKTVAVVGSGPAGLAAAQQLTRAGHTVAVFERADRIGGLLRYGIPEFRMERSVLDRRLAQMEAEGTRFRSSANVGVDITGRQLRARYDAIVLAVGSGTCRDLPVPGRHLGGVIQAMQYLPPANRLVAGDEVPEQVTAAGKDVVVIGGGDTGADCLGTALRQGARSVVQLEILPRPPEERPANQPWPTYPMIYRTSTAHEEGGERLFSVGTEEFLDDGGGNVAGLRIVDVELVDGRFTPVAGSERVIPAQLVVLAMGFVGPERGPLLEQLGVELDERGNIRRDAGYSATVPGVFVAGDAGRGQSLIVWAIAEGRSVAAAVDRWLMGETHLPAPVSATARPMTI